MFCFRLRAETLSPSDAAKYELAISKADLVIAALKNENAALQKAVLNSNFETQRAIKLAAEQNWGIPAEVWVIGGLLAGTGVGILVGRSLK